MGRENLCSSSEKRVLGMVSSFTPGMWLVTARTRSSCLTPGTTGYSYSAPKAITSPSMDLMGRCGNILTLPEECASPRMTRPLSLILTTTDCWSSRPISAVPSSSGLRELRMESSPDLMVSLWMMRATSLWQTQGMIEYRCSLPLEYFYENLVGRGPAKESLTGHVGSA